MPGDMRITDRVNIPSTASRMKNKTSSPTIVSRPKSSRAEADVKSSAPLTLAALRALRLRAQGLAPRRPAGGLLTAVQAVVGVNAQLVSAMALSLRARVAGLTAEALEHSRVAQRALVRTWCMRGTLHLLPAGELEGLLAAISPNDVRGAGRWLEKRAGLKGERAQLVLDTAYQVLKRDGPLTRRALMAAVSAEVGFETRAAAAGVVFLNGLLGRVCFGPFDGAEPAYAALDEWLGRPIQMTQAPDHVALARRYLRGYGPATPRDLAAWWGLSLREARAAWASLSDELVELDVAGQPAWLLAADATVLRDRAPAERTVRLLPAFDTYLLGYADREFAVPKPYRQHIFHGGQVAPTIIIDGLAAGTWRYAQTGKQMRIILAPFRSFSRAEREEMAEEAEDVSRFYGLELVLSDTG